MGRVVLDAETSASGAKLNNASVVLESSRSAGSGVRIPLKFDSNLKLRGIAKDSGIIGLFPGAMVAARGRNGGGEWFLVSEMLSVGVTAWVLHLIADLTPATSTGSKEREV
jgi:DNA polymerase alpha subunit B